MTTVGTVYHRFRKCWRGRQGRLWTCTCSSGYFAVFFLSFGPHFIDLPHLSLAYLCGNSILTFFTTSFYTSLFLQREGAEDILDFWLDVQQHENLCRAYFKDVRKSGRTIREEWPQYWDYARRRGSIYGTVLGLGGNTGGYDTKRSSSTSGAKRREKEPFGDHEPDLSGEKELERGQSPRAFGSTTPGLGKERRHADSTDEPRSSTPFSLSGRASALFKRASRAPTIIPRSSAISRADLVASAERIYYRYLAPPSHINAAGTENHEIYLPPALRIHSFPLTSTNEAQTQEELSILAQVPDMFHAQKQYCFRAMEQDAFPRFLRAKAFGNLTPVSALVRLVAGLVTLWIGLAVGFALIFLDVQPKSKRFFVSLFFSLSLFCAQTHQPPFSCSSPLALPSFASSVINTSLIQSSSSWANPKRHPSVHFAFANRM